MKEITFRDSVEIWQRWIEVAGNTDPSRKLLNKFLGGLDLHPEMTNEGFMVSSHEADRGSLITGPHYRAIIKAWCIREAGNEV